MEVAMKTRLRKLVVFFFLFGQIMICQISQHPTGAHQHDGFFLRFLPGSGYSQVFVDIISFSGGFTFANTIQIGGTVSDNLIIFGDIGGVNILSPSVKINDEDVDNPGDVRIVFGGFGPGVCYYLMPDNYYISLSILLHQSNFYLDNLSGIEADNGFGFNFVIGKEWWVGEQWGLGVSLYFRYGAQSQKNGTDVTISSYSLGALFTATLN
jgi:hypothetical protein